MSKLGEEGFKKEMEMKLADIMQFTQSFEII